MIVNSPTWKYATLARLTANSPVLNVEMTFWANGARGYYHGDKSCRKRKKGNPVPITATPESATRKACTECFIPSLVEQMPAARALTELIGICAMIEPHARTAAADGTSLEALHNAVTGLSHAARRLGLLHGQPEAENAYGTAVAKLESDIRTATATARTRMNALRDELVIPVAIELMRPASNGSLELQPTGAELIVFGDDQGSYHPASRNLFMAWADSKTSPRTAEQRSQRLAEGAAQIKLTSIGQLRGVPAVTTAGLTADEAAIQAWTTEKNRIVNRLVTLWNETLDELLADDSTELAVLGASRISGGSLASTILEAYAIARRDRDALVAVRVPRTIALWLASQYRPAVSMFEAAHYAGDAPQDVIDTAIELWDATDRQSPYRTFTACINAAKALLAN